MEARDSMLVPIDVASGLMHRQFDADLLSAECSAEVCGATGFRSSE